jgi:hypothetical protein
MAKGTARSAPRDDREEAKKPRLPIFSESVERVRVFISPDADLESAEFRHAVLDDAVSSGNLTIETDGVYVAVFAGPRE